jgi:hypothetical protein
MEEQLEKMDFPVWLPGPANPKQLEECPKTPSYNSHSAIPNIWAPIDDVFQEMVFRQLRLTVSSVKIKSFKPRREGLLMTADFTIKNDSSIDIRDITVTCTHYAKNGTKIDSNTRTIYDIIKAGKSKNFRKFIMGFIHSKANSSYCEITNLKIVD